jgi:hypothetical protein
MKGADYVAVEALYDKAGKVVAAAGASCAAVPEASLAWLLEGGHIKLAEKAKVRATGDVAITEPVAARAPKKGKG